MLLDSGKTPEQIASLRHISKSTVYSHIGYLYEKGEQVDIFHYITEEEIKKVSGACAVVSHMVYAGTVLKIDGMVVNISTNREEKNGIIFRKENRSVHAMEM